MSLTAQELIHLHSQKDWYEKWPCGVREPLTPEEPDNSVSPFEAISRKMLLCASDTELLRLKRSAQDQRTLYSTVDCFEAMGRMLNEKAQPLLIGQSFQVYTHGGGRLLIICHQRLAIRNGANFLKFDAQ